MALRLGHIRGYGEPEDICISMSWHMVDTLRTNVTGNTRATRVVPYQWWASCVYCTDFLQQNVEAWRQDCSWRTLSVSCE